MTTFRKLGFYLIGFAVGLIFLAYFFRGKKTEFCYFPNCRVLKDIRNSPLEYGPLVQQLLDNNSIKPEDLKLLLEEGEVNFKKSQTDRNPCKLYLIEGQITSEPVLLTVERCQDKTILQKLDKQ